jgi:hypothetical protein
VVGLLFIFDRRDSNPKGSERKKVCRWHTFREERRSGYAASRRLRSRRQIPPGGPEKRSSTLVAGLLFIFQKGGIRTRKGPSVKKVCRWHTFREERRSGYAASRRLRSRRQIPPGGPEKEAQPSWLGFFLFSIGGIHFSLLFYLLTFGLLALPFLFPVTQEKKERDCRKNGRGQINLPETFVQS